MAELQEVSQEVGWRRVLKDCSEHTSKAARMWLWYTLFYWLIPTVVAVGVLLIAGAPVHPLELIKHGELLIYAITLIAGSTRLVTKDISKTGPFVDRQLFNLVSQVLILPAIVAYGLLRYFAVYPPQNGVNNYLVAIYSIVVLVCAFVFAYVVFVIDAQRTAQFQGDVQRRATEAIAHSPDKLARDFKALQPEKPATVPAEVAPAEVAVTVIENAVEAEERVEAEEMIVQVNLAAQENPPAQDDLEHLEDER